MEKIIPDLLVEEKDLTLNDGHPIECYHLLDCDSEEILNAWALHIRRHYSSDEHLKTMSEIFVISKEQFLKEYRIPQKGDTNGPRAISGDFCEILCTDFLEFIKGYESPRVNKLNRSGKCLSEHGTDVLAFKMQSADKISENDELYIVEVKGGLSQNNYDALSQAIEHSSKDAYRYSHTLSYLIERCMELQDTAMFQKLSRFANPTEHPYKETYAACAVIGKDIINQNIVDDTEGDKFIYPMESDIIVIHRHNFMEFVYSLYERCIK